MKLISVISLFSLVQLCRTAVKEKRQISIIENQQKMDYLTNNADDIVGKVLNGGPESTELLTRVATYTLTAATQAWYRCSRRFGIKREKLAENLREYVVYKNKEEACATSCFAEELKGVRDGQIDLNMTSLMIMSLFGDDRTLLRYTREVASQCNKKLPPAPVGSCTSVLHFECFMRGVGKGGISIPAGVELFSNPIAMEITAK